ncbi:MAG: multiprotein bridging factor aMBF1 [Candidatus Hodarchaeota archaeon]
MSCEICGREIHGRRHKIRVEGTIIVVCSKCSDLGEKVYEPRKSSSYIMEGTSSSYHKKKKPSYPRTSSSPRPPVKKVRKSDVSYDLVDNYPKIVRKARGTMTQEDFADLLNEKMTLIQKIETGKMKPTVQLARKIEKKFHVKLLKPTDDPDEESDATWIKDKKDSYVPSLGDFIKED